jgi:hypothetical protein
MRSSKILSFAFSSLLVSPALGGQILTQLTQLTNFTYDYVIIGGMSYFPAEEPTFLTYPLSWKCWACSRQSSERKPKRIHPSH